MKQSQLDASIGSMSDLGVPDEILENEKVWTQQTYTRGNNTPNGTDEYTNKHNKRNLVQ